MNLNELKNKALEIATKKGWNQGSSKHYICLVISELMEAVEADRKNKHANLGMFYTYINPNLCKEAWADSEAFRRDVYKYGFETYIKDTVEDELSDAFIRLLHLAGLRNVYVGSCGITPYYNPSDHNCFTEWVFDVVKDLVDYRLESEPILKGLANIFGYCLHNHIDLERHVIEKMKYNELREDTKAY